MTADRYLYATGAHDRNALFEDNDRPGVLAARAVGRLLVQHGVVAGREIALVGETEGSAALARALTSAGATVTSLRAILGVDGGSEISAVRTQDGTIACDLVAVAATPAPASELLREHGARVRFAPAQGGFVALTDDHGRAADNVWACGDVTGYRGPHAAAEHGVAVGRAALLGDHAHV